MSTLFEEISAEYVMHLEAVNMMVKKDPVQVELDNTDDVVLRYSEALKKEDELPEEALSLFNRPTLFDLSVIGIMWRINEESHIPTSIIDADDAVYVVSKGKEEGVNIQIDDRLLERGDVVSVKKGYIEEVVLFMEDLPEGF